METCKNKHVSGHPALIYKCKIVEERDSQVHATYYSEETLNCDSMYNLLFATWKYFTTAHAFFSWSVVGACGYANVL